ncbi:MAG: extracellular solute-binding protein [Acutalibacteraceae bacterium]
MKRVFCSILAGLMMLSMFTGCSSSQNSSAAADGEKTVVELWTVWKTDAETGSGKVLREAAEEFMAQNPDIVINISNQGGYDDIAEKLEASIVAKNPPTLATVEETHVQRFSPVAADLSQYLPAEVIDNYVDGLMHTCTIDGVVKAVPFGRSSTILYMNKNLVEAAGLSTDGPKTWEEFYQYAEAMTDPENGVYGWGQDFDTDAWIWESMLYSYGGEIISDDLKTVLFDETPASYEIVETMQDMADAGTLFNPYSMQGEAWDKSKFIEGKIGMLITSIASSSEIQRLGRENGFETVLAFQPMGTEYSVPTGGNNIIMFESASDAEKEAAAKFLEFLASDEIRCQAQPGDRLLPCDRDLHGALHCTGALADFPSYQKALDSAAVCPQPSHDQELEEYVHCDSGRTQGLHDRYLGRRQGSH